MSATAWPAYRRRAFRSNNRGGDEMYNSSRRISGLLSLIALSLLSASGSGGFLIRYEIIDLGTFGGSTSVALGINNKGQVVGGAGVLSAPRSAFLWDDGVLTDLGNVGVVGSYEAWDVNENTQIVGTITVSGNTFNSFIWEDGQISELSVPDQSKTALAINDAGQIVGGAIFPPPISGQHAMLLEDGVLTDLTAGGYCWILAWDINTQGDIVGGPCIWRDGANVDLGLLGGGGGAAVSINDLGQAVGNANRADGTVVPVRWDDGEITDLSVLVDPLADFVFSKAEAINNKGQIVGAGTIQFSAASGAVASGAISEGFIVDPLTGAAMLKDTLAAGSGWSAISPRDINDKGQIVGAATTPEGFRHAFLMNPLPAIPATSPGVLMLMAIGIGVSGYTLLTRRRKMEPEA
jgi:probable HAF family extracellular repeat protein